jgi:transcriptional regulator with GAF, ATPase, and Fis domain
VTRRILAGETVAIAALDDLPAEAAADLAAFRRFETRSTVAVPLEAHGAVFGCLSFATTRTARRWPGALVARFELVAQVFAKALARAETERELQAALRDVKRLRDQLQHDNMYLRDEIRERRNPTQIVGTSAALRRALDLVGQVAPTGATVLLLGETGTGKERIAAAIHELSPRRSRPMVKVNCAAIPGTLIESELFGREKGAYTGALTRQTGRFDLANGSTIFLDEIGDLPLETQTKLLRVIETREFERLGSPSPVHVDARIIAATNRNLDEAVRDGRFREDLYFRLNVFPIRLPALRERPEDIPLLAMTIVDELSASMGRQFDAISRTSLLALQQYHWPGNIRELRNVVERAMITSDGSALKIELPSAPVRRPGSSPLSLKALEREHVLTVLQQTGWRIRGPRGAAAVLGLPPTTLENRMQRLGIVRPGKKLP